MLRTAMARITGRTKRTRTSGGRPARGKKAPRIVRIAQRLGRRIPEDELQSLPKDLSSQLDHYVYGIPKR